MKSAYLLKLMIKQLNKKLKKSVLLIKLTYTLVNLK